MSRALPVEDLSRVLAQLTDPMIMLLLGALVVVGDVDELLRAVGGTRGQVRTVVRRESVLVSLLGALTGIALGTVSGIALSRALVEEGITTIAVPTMTLAVYLVVVTAVGVLAAIGPARRASKIDVLQAITTD